MFLDEAMGASRAELAAYLDEACGDDPALQERVEELLPADGEAEGLLPHRWGGRVGHGWRRGKWRGR